MKLLEMIATLGPGGAEALVCDLALHLAGRGAEVKLFLLAGAQGDRGRHLLARLESAGIEVIGEKPRRPASVRNLTDVVGVMNRFRPDIVHAHMYNSEVPAAIGKFCCPGKSPVFVRTIHNTEIVGYRSKMVSALLARLFDYHVPCAESVNDAYLAYIRKEADKRVVTIPNGCTLAAEQTKPAEREEARRRLSIAPGARMICHIGAFRGANLETSQKAHDTLIRAFACAFGGESGVVLACAGDGPLRGAAESLAQELGVIGQIIFLGNIPEPWQLLKAADLYAMPSRHEGLSLALLEAVSTGLPVIASDIPEIRSVCTGEGIVLCPVDDVGAFSAAFRSVASNLPHYRLEAERGAVDVRLKNSIDGCARSYWDLFCKILAADRHRHDLALRIG